MAKGRIFESICLVHSGRNMCTMNEMFSTQKDITLLESERLDISETGMEFNV